MINLTLEDVKSVVIEKVSSRLSVPQSSSPWKKAAQLELLYYMWNTKEILKIRCLSLESQNYWNRGMLARHSIYYGNSQSFATLRL